LFDSVMLSISQRLAPSGRLLKPYLIPWSASISRCSLSFSSLLRFYPRQRSTHVSLPVCQCPLSLMSDAKGFTL